MYLKPDLGLKKSNLWVIKRTPLCIARSMYHFSSRHVMLVSDFLYYTANILTCSVFCCVTVYTAQCTYLHCIGNIQLLHKVLCSEGMW